MNKEREGGGRVPPPAQHRFKPGERRSPGRPRGALSLKRLTRKVALRRLSVLRDGRRRSMTLLELVIERLILLAAKGNPSAARYLEKVRDQIIPPGSDGRYEPLIVPETATVEQWEKIVKRHNWVIARVAAMSQAEREARDIPRSYWPVDPLVDAGQRPRSLGA